MNKTPDPTFLYINKTRIRADFSNGHYLREELIAVFSKYLNNIPEGGITNIVVKSGKLGEAHKKELLKACISYSAITTLMIRRSLVDRKEVITDLATVYTNNVLDMLMVEASKVLGQRLHTMFGFKQKPTVKTL